MLMLREEMMRFWDFLKILLTNQRPNDIPPNEPPPPATPETKPERGGRSIANLAKQIGLSPLELASAKVAYETFTIPKRTKKTRPIAAPEDSLKKLQRQILNQLLTQLPTHPTAQKFKHNHSIATNTRQHTN